jgi:hypothetical protein
MHGWVAEDITSDVVETLVVETEPKLLIEKRVSSSVLSRLLGFGGGGGGGMKGDEERCKPSDLFLLAYRNYWGNSEVWGEN